MSIETLLEAAKFLELQAQQQQKAREEDLKEKLRLEQIKSDVNYNSAVVHLSSHVVPKTEELRAECRLVPAPPSLPPASLPVALMPLPVVKGSPTLPVATLSHLAAPTLKRDPQSPAEEKPCSVQSPLLPKTEHNTTTPPPISKQNHQHHPQLIAPNNNNKQQQQQLVQRFPGPLVSPPPPPQALLPQPGSVLQQAPVQNGRGSPPDDGRQLDKKRPGGAGTREVHNKLEKHRRAHLKECFETLKKNVPNIDEKKTSNLSVLRSALRYIQTLKRKEKEYEHDMERLAREKIATQQRLAELKNDLSQWMDVMEIERVLRQTVQPEEDQASTSTASEGEEEAMEDDVEDEEEEEEEEAGGPTARAQTSTLPTAPPPAAKPELHKAPTHSLSLAPISHAPTPNSHAPTSISHTSISHTSISQAPTSISHAPTSISHAPTHISHAPITTATSFITQHISIQHKPHLQPLLLNPAPPPPGGPAHTQVLTAPSLHPTVIAHASVSHPSVIQAVNHVIQGGGPKHLAHLASPGPVQLGPAHQPIGHITVHPVAHLGAHLGPHLGPHLPTLYPQPVAVTQSAVVGHITHTLNHHAQVNGAAGGGKAPAAVGGVSAQVVAHHPQLVGGAVLNPVTMVTVPSFPISTLKLA